MGYLKKYRISIISFLIITSFFSSCYKKDLEEFKNATLEIKSDVAFPLFNATISIKDSLPHLPDFNISDSIYLVNEDINLSDSLALTFDGYTINDIQFKLYIKNSFPIKGTLQVYFLNNKNTVIDSLFTINKYPVENASHTIISEVYIDINNEKYKNLAKCSKVKIAYRIKNKNTNYEPYELFVGCGVLMNINKKIL